MEKDMHDLIKAAATAAIVALAGCTNAPPAQPVTPPAAAAPAIAAAQPAEEMLTGSRIPKRKTSDRMLKTVGAQDARDAMSTALQPLDANPGR
jgi:uncharacterized lipoprotein YajG